MPKTYPSKVTVRQCVHERSVSLPQVLFYRSFCSTDSWLHQLFPLLLPAAAAVQERLRAEVKNLEARKFSLSAWVHDTVSVLPVETDVQRSYHRPQNRLDHAADLEPMVVHHRRHLSALLLPVVPVCNLAVAGKYP